MFHFHTPGFGRSEATNIRALQIMPYFPGSTINFPEDNNGIHIYVKRVPSGDIPVYCYCDIIDADSLLCWLAVNRDVNIITMSNSGVDYLSTLYDKKRIVLIPQQHCNTKRIHIPKRPVKTVGFMGSPSSCRLPLEQIEKALSEVGLHFISYIAPRDHRRVVRFYKNIDIQIVYRPWQPSEEIRIKLKDGLKIFNAGSFGIPTVSTQGPEYDEECKGAYLTCSSLDELVKQCKRLKEDRTLYQEISGRAGLIAEKHHIDNILPSYKKLLEIY